MPTPSPGNESHSAPAGPYASLLNLAAEYAQSYLATIHDRHVGVTDLARQGLSRLGGEIPLTGAAPEAVLRLLHEAGSPATVAVMGGRFFGGVIRGSIPVTVAAHWLADAWDQNACLYEISPVAARLEEVVLEWLIHLFGLPATSGGALVTGSQMADVTALAAARHALLRDIGWDVESDGLFGAPPVSVFVGEEVHATMLKALALIGFGRARVHRIPVDSQGRMLPSRIPRIVGPAVICAQLGNVNSGACDPIADICDVAKSSGAWVHVDGAFGLWAATAPQRSHLVLGMEHADSWATDGHKWLNTPHDCGIAIVRDREALRHAMAISAAYYGPLSRCEPMQWRPESSRRARGVELWAALRTLGKSRIAAQIERTCNHATQFAVGLREAGYNVLNEVVLNQVLVSFGSDEHTERVIAGVQTTECAGAEERSGKEKRP